MSRRNLLALLGLGAALAMPVAAGAQPYQHTTQATAQGTGGAAATRGQRRHGARRSTCCGAAATRSTRPSPRRRCSA